MQTGGNSLKANTTDKLLGLLIITGFGMLINAFPVGIFLTLLAYYKGGSDWHWAITQGAVITTAIVIVGLLFTYIGEFIVKRRWKKQKKAVNAS
jgi:uncharacterized membrane protein YphA (DoxX/SURF4 family)